MIHIENRVLRLLQEFHQELVELGVEATYLDTAPDRPVPSIVVQAPPDDQGRERAILLAFIPDDSEFEEIDLFQLYTPLPVSLSQEALAAKLPLVNEQAVLGHAGIMPTGEIYWRYVWALPRGLPIIPSVLFEVIQLFVVSAELGTIALTE